MWLNPLPKNWKSNIEIIDTKKDPPAKPSIPSIKLKALVKLITENIVKRIKKISKLINCIFMKLPKLTTYYPLNITISEPNSRVISLTIIPIFLISSKRPIIKTNDEEIIIIFKIFEYSKKNVEKNKVIKIEIPPIRGVGSLCFFLKFGVSIKLKYSAKYLKIYILDKLIIVK